MVAENIADRPARMAAVGAWADEYVSVHGLRPPAYQLDLLADYILREELTDSHPDKMSREEYPIMSEWQRTRRMRVRFLAGVVEINYGRSTGFRRTSYVDDDGVMREVRQRLCAWPS